LKKFCILITDLSYFLSLTLQGNLVDDEMIKWLVPGLITNQTLRELDLSSNKITQKGMIKICSYLVRTRALISLDLTNNLINSDASYAIGLVIKENTRLRVLKLAMNRLDDVAGARITKMLSRNKFLIELDLSNNLLGQETLNNLLISLKFNNTIKIVNLCHNEIEMTDETKTIADNHPSLIELNLRHTLSSKESVEELEEILIKKSIKLKLGNKNTL
jgi:Ran GTPase-activating protein (RanGAP) involved in mRNA processing and transport